MSEFVDRFTVLPDSGSTELHCSRCVSLGREPVSWVVGYHPSLDVVIEQANEHNAREHPPQS